MKIYRVKEECFGLNKDQLVFIKTGIHDNKITYQIVIEDGSYYIFLEKGHLDEMFELCE